MVGLDPSRELWPSTPTLGSGARIRYVAGPAEGRPLAIDVSIQW
jgi:hypothetical protein